MSGQAYVQEACLGRVRTKKGKKTILYLIKWQDYDKLADITCEPPDNVLVQRVEEPLLDQASEDFRKDLAALLKKYLESHPSTKSPVKAPKRRIVADDDAEDAAEPAPKKKPAPSAGASKVPAGGAAVDKWPALLGGASCPLAPDVERTGDRYTVTKYRQFVLLPPTEEDGKDWVGVFMKVQVAKLNPGLVFSHPKCLLGPAPPDSLTPPLYGSVDGASRDGGVGWFFHHESGVSIDGIRCAKSDQVPAFVEGDTVGLIVDLRASTAFLVRNDVTTGKVVFAPGSCRGKGLRFALHLCVGDVVEVLPDSSALQKYARHDNLFELTCEACTALP